MSDLQALQEYVADCMDRILSVFKEGVLITVIIRTPNEPTRDFLMTSDDPAEVINLIERRIAAANGGRDADRT